MIVHMDADCFFVSVERAKNSALQGRAVVVGGDVRGVVSSASYEARSVGVRSAMPIWEAKRLCPCAVFLPVDMESYSQMSARLFELLDRFSPFVERCSVDEGYLDISYSNDPIQTARDLQSAVKGELGITISLGIATSKLVAQIAGKMNKPEGFTYVEPGTEQGFLAPLDISWLPGFGPKTTARIKAQGIATIGAIACMDAAQAKQVFGHSSAQVIEWARGIDGSAVDWEKRDPKSYGEQETFDVNTSDMDFVLCKMKSMADRLMSRVRGDRKYIFVVEVRLRTPTFYERVKSTTLKLQTDNEEDVYPHIVTMLGLIWDGHPVRLAGVKFGRVTSHPPNMEMNLFPCEKRVSVTRVLDKLRTVVGDDKIIRAHCLVTKKREPRGD